MVFSTIQINQYSSEVITMTWNKNTTEADVRQAYREINRLLDHAAQPMFVVVDITSNPQFPINATVKGALLGPHRHPNLQGWLVVGKSSLGQMIGHMLTALSSTKNIIWFDTQSEALAYAQAKTEAQQDMLPN